MTPNVVEERWEWKESLAVYDVIVTQHTPHHPELLIHTTTDPAAAAAGEIPKTLMIILTFPQ